MEEKNFEIIEVAPTYKELLELHLYVNRKVFVPYLVWGAVFIATAILGVILEFSFNVSIMAFFGVFLMLVGVLVYFAARSNAKKSYEKSRDVTERWHVYPDHIEYHLYRGETEESFFRFDVDKIEEVSILKTLYAFKYDKVAFGVTKTELSPDSLLYGILFPSGKVKGKKPRGRTVEVFYRILTVITLFCALLVFGTISIKASLWWLTLVGFVFPISLLVIFAIAKIDGIKIRGAVLGIISSIVSLLLMILALFYGMVSIIGDGYVPQESILGDTAIYDRSVIEVAGMEFPYTDDYYYDEYKHFDMDLGKYVSVENITYYYYEEAHIDEICSIVENGKYWTPVLKEDAAEFFGSFIDYYEGDMFFVYNATEDTYNSLPVSDGECEYITVNFSSRYDCLDVYRFRK